MFKTTLKIYPSTSSNTSTSQDSDAEQSQNDARAFRPTPLSATETFGIVGFLAVFSFIYLIYAQHHKVLFYVMTSLIALWILFIYAAGIFCVLYMVVVGHSERPQTDDVEKSDDHKAHQESML